MSNQPPPTQAMPPQPPGPPAGGDGSVGTGGPQPPSRGPWIIAGSIVVVGLIVVIALVLLFRDSSPEPEASPSPSVTETVSPSASPTPTRTRPPKPSVTPTPQPSPSPTVDNATLVREATQDAADADRPGEVKHVGNVAFMKNSSCATRNGASASVRYTSPIKQATFFLCQKSNGAWKVTQGPLYGE